MSPIFAKKAKIPLQQKKGRDAYEVTSVDDKALNYNNGVVDHKTEDTRLQIGPHVQDMQFDIMLTGKHNVVLGLPWLQDVDPKISF